MMKHLTAAFAATALLIAPANAVLIDFANEADTNGERGVASGTQMTIDGVNLELVAFGANATFNPYLDAGNAGLGVCQVLIANDQCDPGNDDNVTDGEILQVFFLDAAMTSDIQRDILGLVFRDATHNLLGVPGNDGMVEIQTTNGTMTELFSTFIAMAMGGDAFFASTVGIGLTFVDTQFYLSALDVSDVPIPAALPLLFSGLAGLGFASRKKRKQA